VTSSAQRPSQHREAGSSVRPKPGHRAVPNAGRPEARRAWPVRGPARHAAYRAVPGPRPVWGRAWAATPGLRASTARPVSWRAGTGPARHRGPSARSGAGFRAREERGGAGRGPVFFWSGPVFSGFGTELSGFAMFCPVLPRFLNNMAVGGLFWSEKCQNFAIKRVAHPSHFPHPNMAYHHNQNPHGNPQPFLFPMDDFGIEQNQNQFPSSSPYTNDPLIDHSEDYSHIAYTHSSQNSSQSCGSTGTASTGSKRRKKTSKVWEHFEEEEYEEGGVKKLRARCKRAGCTSVLSMGGGGRNRPPDEAHQLPRQEGRRVCVDPKQAPVQPRRFGT